MRLAVFIAAWSQDPDATLPPDAPWLPSALAALGFSTARADAGDPRTSLDELLGGVEEGDTLVVHVGGVLDEAGALTRPAYQPTSLAVIADALAARPLASTLVVLDVAHRGDDDSLSSALSVEAAATALRAKGARFTTVVAAQKRGPDAERLEFTRLVLDAVQAALSEHDGALVDDAYAAAKERKGSGTSAFGLFHGHRPFRFSRRVGEGAVRAGEAVASAIPTDRESTRALDIADIATPRPRDAKAAAPTAAPTAREFPSAPESSTPVALGDTAASPVWPAPVAAAGQRAVSSPDWVEASDVIEAPTREQLDARIAAAVGAGEYGVAVQLSRERLPYLSTVEARVDELFEIGRMLVAKLRDLPAAVLTLEEARAIDPSRLDVLEALRRAYARLLRWTETLEVTLALVRKTEDAHERAGLRVAAAELARQHLSDEDYALDLLGLALDDDPAHDAALEQLTLVRRSRGELVDLERLLATVAEKLVEKGDAARAWDVCQRLATVRRDDLGDAVGAVEALAIAKRLPLSDLDSRAVLAEQLLALNDDEGALAELEAIVADAPEHVRAHARIFSLHHRSGDHDRAYLSALVLEELGDAGATARELLDAYRADWGLRAQTALDERGWSLLRSRGADAVVEAVFTASLRAAIAAETEARGKPVALDPSRRQPESSTASIVRCFHWAARALGTPCPALYVLDDVVGGIAAVPAHEPTTALGPAVLRGLSSKTLAFLAGRHLTYFRPEYQALVHFPTMEAAAGLFFAAIDLVAPGTFVPPNLALRVASAKHRLARQLRPDELAALSATVGRMEARDARVDLIAWIRSVEVTANRAGLLLSGDLQTALTQVRAEPRGLSGLTVEERRTDLLAFCASRPFGELRASYADTTPASMRPPTSVSAVVHRDDPSLHGRSDPGQAARASA